jgi:5-methylcytosine-specific restriction endonuclease McrA
VLLAGLAALVEDGSDSVDLRRRNSRNSLPGAQIVVRRCPVCERATVVTRQGEKVLTPPQAAALACDAQVREDDGPNRSTIPPSARAKVLARDGHRCTSPGCGATRFLEVHHVTPRNDGGTNQAENLVTLCSRCHRFTHERRPA